MLLVALRKRENIEKNPERNGSKTSQKPRRDDNEHTYIHTYIFIDTPQWGFSVTIGRKNYK